MSNWQTCPNKIICAFQSCCAPDQKHSGTFWSLQAWLQAGGPGGRSSSAALVALLQQLAQGRQLVPPQPPPVPSPDHTHPFGSSGLHLPFHQSQYMSPLQQQHQSRSAVAVSQQYQSSLSSPIVASSTAQDASYLHADGGCFPISSSHTSQQPHLAYPMEPQLLTATGRPPSLLDRLAASSGLSQPRYPQQAVSPPAAAAWNANTDYGGVQQHARAAGLPADRAPSTRATPVWTQQHAWEGGGAADGARSTRATPLNTQQHAWEGGGAADGAPSTRTTPVNTLQQHAWEGGGAPYGPPPHLLRGGDAVPQAARTVLGRPLAGTGARAGLSNAPHAVCASCFSSGTPKTKPLLLPCCISTDSSPSGLAGRLMCPL